jgi:hypothetical protein
MIDANVCRMKTGQGPEPPRPLKTRGEESSGVTLPALVGEDPYTNVTSASRSCEDIIA